MLLNTRAVRIRIRIWIRIESEVLDPIRIRSGSVREDPITGSLTMFHYKLSKRDQLSTLCISTSIILFLSPKMK